MFFSCVWRVGGSLPRTQQQQREKKNTFLESPRMFNVPPFFFFSSEKELVNDPGVWWLAIWTVSRVEIFIFFFQKGEEIRKRNDFVSDVLFCKYSFFVYKEIEKEKREIFCE